MEYFMKCMRLYATFDGRARRSEFWYFYLFYMIASFLVGFIAGAINFQYLPIILALGLIVPYIAVAIRRMHDVGKSGWFILIPIYNLILFLTPGETGPNKYGPDPKTDGGFSNSEVLDDQIV